MQLEAKPASRALADTMFISKPPLNLLAGWQFLLDRSYREELRTDWQTEPAWVVLIQMTAGACSVVFPLIVVGLLVFVFIARHF